MTCPFTCPFRLRIGLGLTVTWLAAVSLVYRDDTGLAEPWANTMLVGLLAGLPELLGGGTGSLRPPANRSGVVTLLGITGTVTSPDRRNCNGLESLFCGGGGGGGWDSRLGAGFVGCGGGWEKRGGGGAGGGILSRCG